MSTKQKEIDELLVRHAKDFIPQMVEFKLSSVINGSSKETTSKTGVFPDSPMIGQTYVPRRLEKVIKKIKNGPAAV